MFTRAEVFSTNLLAAMQRKNVSRRELARRIRPDDPEQARSEVRRALRGVHEPQQRTVDKFADALSVTPDELLPDEDEQEAALVDTVAVDMLEALESQLRLLKVRMGRTVAA